VAIRQAVTNPTFQANAQSLQPTLQAEAGTARAVAWLAQHFLSEE
jgi:hypothetical protein